MKYEFQTTQERSQLMQKIKSTETQSEIYFRKLLWARGIRYRKNDRKLPGRPDVSISKYKIAVFIDGEFWHGLNWEAKKNKLRSNKEYWIPKIEANIERDKKTNNLLRDAGWNVIRFWESQIKKTPEECVDKIAALINDRNLHV